jgi:hypothetical protein
MKNISLYLFPVFVLAMLSACDKEEASVGPDCGIELKLVQMGGGIANVPPKEGDDMAWQESIFLYGDSSFTKRKTRDGATTEASGTYANKKFDNDTHEYIELTYHNPKNAPVESCNSADGKESIVILSDSKFQGTWGMCDGPTLVYEGKTMSCQD